MAPPFDVSERRMRLARERCADDARETREACERETGADGWMEDLARIIEPGDGEEYRVKCDLCKAQVASVAERRGYRGPNDHEIIVDWYKGGSGAWVLSRRTVGAPLSICTIEAYGGFGIDD